MYQKFKITLVALFILISQAISFAQSQDPKVNIGPGFGLDYGGIGGRIAYNPVSFFGIFGGVGFNFLTAGVNAGIQLRIAMEGRVTPYLTGMYGYNGVIWSLNSSIDSKTYYGPTFGVGTEIRIGRKGNFINAELLIPVRPEFNDDVDRLKSSGNLVSEPLPFAISIGYHFAF